MEIINKNVALLSNCEVYTLLKQTKEDLAHKLIKKKNLDPNNSNLNINVDKHLPTIVYESLRYLEKTPCAQQTPQIVNDFMKAFDDRTSEFKLTKIEKLQILNQRPSTAVELQYLIEDSEERFSIEQMDQLLEIINAKLPINDSDNNQEQDADLNNSEAN